MWAVEIAVKKNSDLSQIRPISSRGPGRVLT